MRPLPGPECWRRLEEPVDMARASAQVRAAMKRTRIGLLLVLLLAPLVAAAANPEFAGRWRLDPARSTALDGWHAADLVIALDGSKVALTYHMTWRTTKFTATNTVDTAQPQAIEDFFRIEQRHMAVYPRPGESAQVTAAWLDAGETLRVEAAVPVGISQGEGTMRLYHEFRLLEGGTTLLLIELHSTRHRPLVYHFTKVSPETATN